MMIFLDDIIFSGQKAGGISMVWSNLVKQLLLITDKIKFIEYKDAKQNIFRKPLSIKESDIINSKLSKTILSYFISPRIKYEKSFIFHSSYFRICKNKNAINVTTVHDFIYEQSPNLSLKHKLRIWLNYRAIKQSDAIVCISENTRKDLFKFIPFIDSKKVRVIYNGVSKEYMSLNMIPYPMYKNHILFVGGRQYYKNFDFIVKSLSKTSYKLLICGSPLSQKEITLLEKLIPNKYKFIEYPTNTELNEIYNSVYALAYPSSYEGFGLPVLEAQRAGCPVIALSSSSIPEIIGDKSLLMPELSEKLFLSKLEKLENIEFRDKIIKRGVENSKRFSWEKMASEYYDLYNNLLKLNDKSQ